MRRTVHLAAFAAAVAVVAACGSDSSTTPKSTIVNFKATLSGANEAPAVTTQGTGSFTATLDTATNVFTYDVTYSGLGTNVTAGHIHGPFPNGSAVSAGVILNFATLPGATFVTAALSGAAHGQVTLTSATQISTTVNGDSLRKLLLAGLTYANIHTTANGGGEIRGQILKQ